MSSPATTQSALAMNTPRARAMAGTVASVVTSRAPPRSSSSARWTMSRYSAGSSGERFIAGHHDLGRRSQFQGGVLECLNTQGGFQIRLELVHVAEGSRIGFDRHLGDRHLQGLLVLGPSLSDLEQHHFGRPLVDCPVRTLRLAQGSGYRK